MAATNNPMAGAKSSGSVSSTTIHIAGIKTTIHGLDLLPPPSQCSKVSVLWLLHPRLQTQECMAPVAASVINGWYARPNAKRQTGLIAVSFDQRNHGTRLVDKLANEAWKQGNPRHALDMFSIFQGTAQDTSLLLHHLPGYIFPKSEYSVVRNLVLGISLGGHAAWHCILHEPAITSAVVIIGTPDYTRLMTDRAAKTKLDSWTSSQGRDFVGGPDFPKPLVEQVEKFDPAGLILGELDLVTGDEWQHLPSDAEKKKLYPILRDKLGGKRIMSLSGGQDKLVPYKCSEPFLIWMKKALTKEIGWFNDRGTVLEDVIDEDAGHEYSEKMGELAVKFICESLELDEDSPGGPPGSADMRTSKL